MKELNECMSVDEFHRWMAFSALEPFGDDRADWRTAAQMAQQYNINRKKGAAEAGPEKFLLRFNRQTGGGGGPDLKRMELALMAQYAAWGGKFD